MFFLRLYIIGIGRGGQELEDARCTGQESESRLPGRHAVKVSMHEKKKGHGNLRGEGSKSRGERRERYAKR